MLIKYLKFPKKVEQDRYMVWMKKRKKTKSVATETLSKDTLQTAFGIAG